MATNEQRASAARLRALLDSADLQSARLVPDAEGWPTAPGRYGQLEYPGIEAGAVHRGQERIYAYTDSRRMILKLSSVPGVHRWRIGDDEARFWILADDRPALRTVANLLRLRRRREASTARNIAAYRFTSATQDAPGAAR